MVAFCAAAHAQTALDGYRIEAGSSAPTVVDGDFDYHVYSGGVEFTSGDLRVRADRLVLVVDRDEERNLIEVITDDPALPHRESKPPLSQSEMLASSLRRRVRDRLGSGIDTRVPPGRDRFAPLTRGLLAEGDVVFDKAGVRAVQCSRLWLSLASDRATMEDVVVRLPARLGIAGSGVSLVLRAPRIVQQGATIVARNASLTTCDAGEAHFDMRSERLVITKREGDVYEVLGQGNALKVGILPSLPLPDYRWFSDQDNWIPLQGVSAGSSNIRGEFVFARFGGRFNDLGQHVVDFFGGASQPFRGEWTLRTGYTRKRGIPVEPRLSYRVPEVFDGWIQGFWLDDKTKVDRLSVPTYVDGSPILDRKRSFVRSRNRIWMGEGRRIDVEAFGASDPGAYAEFAPNQLKTMEVPESSIEFRDRTDNRLLTLTGRMDLAGIAYDDRARLTDRFRSERPYLRASLFSQPLFDIAEDVPLVVDANIGAGFLKNQFSDRSTIARSERAFRADFDLEVSTPMTLGDFAVRPWFGARETAYSELDGSSRAAARTSLAAGVNVDTRLSRHFDYASDAFGIDGLWHDVRPNVSVFHRFDVDREPGDYVQFDEVDALDEHAAIDVGVFQRVLTRRKDSEGRSRYDDLVWLDLTQRFHPISGRDNDGHHLGIFAWELIVTPGRGWLPLPNTRVLFEGERDWVRGDYKTRNIGLATTFENQLTAAAEWRTGRDDSGTGSARVSFPAWERWLVTGAIVYNFERTGLDSSTVQLVRQDHDYDWIFTMTKNELTNDSSFTIRFRPTFGGLIRRPGYSYPAGSPAFGVTETPAPQSHDLAPVRDDDQ
ncbi:MAG: hypothetical protein KDC95_05375 [Planctomycetes bacterium]|nr:hypothetical protein [Planctomycetota bacterium]